MMRQDIKDKEFQGNREYVSPSVKVIEVTAQKIICQSGDTEQYGNTNDPDWGF